MSVFGNDIGGAAQVDFGGGGGGFAGGGGAPMGRAATLPSAGGGLRSPIRSPGASNNIVPFRPPIKGGALAGPVRSPLGIGAGAAKAPAPVGGSFPAAPRPLPNRASSIPFPRLPSGVLPGNPFSPRPQAFNPSGAADLPAITYPAQLPSGATGAGPVVIPEIPPPFQGGQMRTRYRITYTVWNRFFGRLDTRTDTAFASFTNMGGPIGGIRVFSGSTGGTTMGNSIQALGTNFTTGAVSWQGLSSIGSSHPGGYYGTPINIVSIERLDGLPDTGGDPPPDQEESRAPNPARPASPRPLPAPAPASSPRPWPQQPRPQSPGQQPLKPISPRPAPLAPGSAPLPDEFRPTAPATAPTTAPATSPTGSPITLPSGTPTGGSTATGSPTTTSGALSGGVRIQPISIPVPIFTPVTTAPTQTPQRVPIQLRQGQPQPATTPITNFIPSEGLTPAITRLTEPVFNEPTTKTDNCATDPRTICKYDGKNIAGKCDEILGKFDANYSLEWNLPDCGDSFSSSKTGAKNGTGLDGIAAQIEALYQAIGVLHSNTRCGNDAVALVPEWWSMRAGSERPQLIVYYRGKNQDGSWSNDRRSFSVPHFDVKNRKALKSMLPKEIRKGAIRGAYALKDNSKMVQFCRSTSEAERVLKQLERLIIPSQRTGDIKIGELRGDKSREFTKITLYPYEARFFATGQLRMMPHWVEKLT